MADTQEPKTTEETEQTNESDAEQTVNASADTDAQSGQQNSSKSEKKKTVAKPKQPDGTEIIQADDSKIIFKATKPLNKEEFELLSYMVKHENEKTGLPIVLMPFTCELGE